MSLDLAKYTNCHIRASVSVFIDSEKLSHWSSKCLCNWQNTQIFALEPQVFLYFFNFSVFSVFLHWSKCFCIYRPDRSRLFAFKGEREVVLHNRETEFRTNKQQRGANLNKVTELEHKKSAPWKLNLFSEQRDLSPSLPACSEPERLAGKSWNFVGEYFFLFFSFFLKER